MRGSDTRHSTTYERKIMSDERMEAAYEKWQADNTNGFHLDDCGDSHFDGFDDEIVARAAFSAGYSAANEWVRIETEADLPKGDTPVIVTLLDAVGEFSSHFAYFMNFDGRFHLDDDGSSEAWGNVMAYEDSGKMAHVECCGWKPEALAANSSPEEK